MKTIIRILISFISFCLLTMNAHALTVAQVQNNAKYKEWVIGANPNARGYLYTKKKRTGPKKYNYNIKGLKIRKFFQYEKQGTWAGINLGWTSNASAKTGRKRAQWFFTRRSNSKGPIVYGERLAIAWGKAGYIKYGRRNKGINLNWSKKKPVYEWMILGGKKGAPVRRNMDRVIIYNTRHKQPLIFYKRTRAGNIGWPDSCRLMSCTGKKIKKGAKKGWKKTKEIARKFETKSKKLARFNKKRRNCKKRRDTCTNCRKPKPNIDLDSDGIPDLLEYNLAHKFFPKVLVFGKKYDLEQAYLYKGYSTPFIVRTIKGSRQCRQGYQCLEIRLSITFLYDAGAVVDYANWGGHTGDAEMYTAVVRRNGSWAQSKSNVNQWKLIRDFTSAHWGRSRPWESSRVKRYNGKDRNKPVTIYSARMKHALYHNPHRCKAGAAATDVCYGKAWNLSQYKRRNSLQNIGDKGNHSRMDTTIEHPECGMHNVWSNKKFGEDSKTSDYFMRKVPYKL